MAAARSLPARGSRWACSGWTARFYAWRNECPHQGGPICQGRLMKGVEERLDGETRSLGIHQAPRGRCTWSARGTAIEFDVRTGRHAGIADVRLASYPVKVRDGERLCRPPS